MRFSQAAIRTYRDVDSDTTFASHRLLLKAGLARQVGSGIWTLAPLGWRVVANVERIVREEMDRIDGQEVALPVVQPAELWRRSGRYDTIGSELARFKDRNDQDLVLAMTHEEAVTDLFASTVESYRQLPQMLYQVQNKFRDEPRPRGGLIRLREFIMKDAYSFHLDSDDLDRYYEVIVEAYLRFFARCSLDVIVVGSDTGMMGGREAHEFMVLSPSGEDTLVICPGCGYAANREIAVFDKSLPDQARAGERDLEEVATPLARSISQLHEQYQWDPERIVKTLAYIDDDDLYLVAIRGDLEVNEVKLANLTSRGGLRPLGDAEAAERGLVMGYLSPVRLDPDLKATLVIDDSLVGLHGLYAGANRLDHHLAGVSYERDLSGDLVGDVALPSEGVRCADCQERIELQRGIEAANTFKLGTKYSAAMGANVADSDGRARPVVMGCYGIGMTRTLACLIEQHHDERGIIWPVSVAPYPMHLVTVGKDADTLATADALYERLGAARVLYDDTDGSPGSKFANADLLGMPVRLTVSPRSLKAGGIEVSRRADGNREVVPAEEVAQHVERLLVDSPSA